MHLTPALPIAEAAVAAATGAPAWVELGVPVITGLFLLAAMLVKDWLAQRRHNPNDGLIETLHRDVKDARLGEADARAQRDLAITQLNVALAELKAYRREHE